MKAVGTNIIVEYIASKTTEGGILLPEAVDAHDASIMVKVISVGSGVTLVKDGEFILIPKLMKTLINKEKGLYNTPESQVLAIVTG